MLKRYRVHVTVTTTQKYDIVAHSEDEVHDLWACDPDMFQVVGQPVTEETLNIGQSVPAKGDQL